MWFLLDTHTFLWYATAHPNLSDQARLLIDEPTNSPYLSIASLWEMAIKVSHDLFDRLMVAQAMILKIPIVSSDTAFDDYAVTRLW